MVQTNMPHFDLQHPSLTRGVQHVIAPGEDWKAAVSQATISPISAIKSAVPSANT